MGKLILKIKIICLSCSNTSSYYKKIKFSLSKKTVYDSFRQGITMGKCKTKAIQTDLGTFRHSQAYSKPCANLAYSEPWYIQNPDTFKTRNIFKTLVHSEPRCIGNSGILNTQGLFRHLRLFIITYYFYSYTRKRFYWVTFKHRKRWMST